MRVVKFDCELCGFVMFVPYENQIYADTCPYCREENDFEITSGYEVKETIKG